MQSGYSYLPRVAAALAMLGALTAGLSHVSQDRLNGSVQTHLPLGATSSRHSVVAARGPRF